MRDPIRTAIEDGRTQLTEAESKRLLEEAGVATPAFELASSPAEAADTAERLGFPVVVKVSSPAVPHKSEWAAGAGVALDLESRDAVGDAAETVFDAAADDGIEADVLVEAAVDREDGTEVIVGGIRKPAFGPVLLVGLGGVFTEIFEDTSHRLAPVTQDGAREAIEDLTAAPLLEGYRGRPPADVAELASVARTVGDLVVDRPEIAEIDLNPVLSGPDGAVALDALVALDADAIDR